MPVKEFDSVPIRVADEKSVAPGHSDRLFNSNIVLRKVQPCGIEIRHMQTEMPGPDRIGDRLLQQVKGLMGPDAIPDGDEVECSGRRDFLQPQNATIKQSGLSDIRDNHTDMIKVSGSDHDVAFRSTRLPVR